MPSQGYMFVQANGTDVPAESTVTVDGRENGIELVEVHHYVHNPEGSGPTSSGIRVHNAVRVVARVGKETPALYQAWTQNQGCEVTIQFYRPNPVGDGTTQHYFTISLVGARVAGVKLLWPSMLKEETTNIPETVEYSFVYSSITWTFNPDNIEHQDTWSSGGE